MRKKSRIFIYTLIIGLLVVANGCKKDKDEITGTFTDSRDGNVYKTIKIGEQVWMAENLKYLPSIVDIGVYSKTSPYYYVYGCGVEDATTNLNDAKVTAYYKTYGVLYNWSAAITSCPAGWHLPSDAEWTELTDYLGGEDIAADKLKEAGTTHWDKTNIGVTNESDFTALPGGVGGHRCYGNSLYGCWWSATEEDTEDAWKRSMTTEESKVWRGKSLKSYGYSIRCIKDEN